MVYYTVGKNNYEVDEAGNVYLLNGHDIKIAFVDKDGYLFHNFHLPDGGRLTKRAHRLVWEAFNGPIEDGLTVDHINGDRKDNRLVNLQLLTSEDNVIKGKESEFSLLSPDGVVHTGKNLAKFCKEHGLFDTAMGQVRLGRVKQHKGWTKHEL